MSLNILHPSRWKTFVVSRQTTSSQYQIVCCYGNVSFFTTNKKVKTPGVSLTSSNLKQHSPNNCKFHLHADGRPLASLQLQVQSGVSLVVSSRLSMCFSGQHKGYHNERLFWTLQFRIVHLSPLYPRIAVLSFILCMRPCVCVCVCLVPILCIYVAPRSVRTLLCVCV